METAKVVVSEGHTGFGLKWTNDEGEVLAHYSEHTMNLYLGTYLLNTLPLSRSEARRIIERRFEVCR